MVRTAASLRNRIDRGSSIPYYVQLKDALMEEIEAKRWEPGDQLPPEQELCTLFGVSRTVVRQALQQLEFEGLVVRERGRGTFIAEPKISSTSLVHSLMGFYEDMDKRGIEMVSDMLEQSLQPAGQHVGAYLRLDPVTPVVKLHRLRSIEQEPIVLVTSYLPYELCPGVLNEDFTHQSLYLYLDEACGLKVARGRRRIEAVSANQTEAEVLQIARGAPLIKMESVSYLRDGTPIEYFHGLFRGDRSCFEMEVARFMGRGPLGEVMGAQPESDWLAA
ncbi:MAG: GntR family transcriptional regulator [Anaerolineales bacterium]|nr:GntR family transcriptional regulator [Anaerolineales bacterium]